MSELNPLLKNVFFSQLRRGCTNAIKEINPVVKNLKKISYLISSNESVKSIQKVVFENYEGEIDMTLEDKIELCKICQMDYIQMSRKYKHTFVTFDFESKKILVQSTLNNGQKENMVL